MITHSEMVRALAKKGVDILSHMNERDIEILHMAVGICGEAGELIDAVKKRCYYNKQLDIQNVIEELGDLEFYMEGMRQLLNISREETLKANIAKLGERYKNFKYSDKAAQERADKIKA